MARYELSNVAGKDLEGIFDYGITHFRLSQALDYQNGLTQRFADLAAHPKRYPAVDHIRKGYRRSVYRAHAIYFMKECSSSEFYANRTRKALLMSRTTTYAAIDRRRAQRGL